MNNLELCRRQNGYDIYWHKDNHDKFEIYESTMVPHKSGGFIKSCFSWSDVLKIVKVN